jgi:hypothetical protein
MKKSLLMVPVFLAVFFAAGCQTKETTVVGDLTGTWRGKVQGKSGALAAMKGLEFMYVFHADGTMTESSNYDASPPCPPAYGVWRKVGVRQFEAKYEFFTGNPPASFDEIAKGGGWAPGGRGVLTEKFTLSAAGNAFASTIRLELFDPQGKPAEGGGDATAQAERMKF